MSRFRPLLTQPVPRDEKLSRALSAKLSPAWGFALYFILYVFLAFSVSGIVILAGAMALIPHYGKPLPDWAQLLVGGAALVFFLGTLVFFFSWVRRRRGRLADLGRNGDALRGQVDSSVRTRFRGTPITKATVLAYRGQEAVRVALTATAHSETLDQGAAIDIIVQDGQRYVAVLCTDDKVWVGTRA